MAQVGASATHLAGSCDLKPLRRSTARFNLGHSYLGTTRIDIFRPSMRGCAVSREATSSTFSYTRLSNSFPERFDLTYVTTHGEEARPVMIHRAVLGSIERFMGVLIEHCGGDFPLWLAPVQVKIVTVTNNQDAYARQVDEQLRQAGIRCELDLRNEKLGYKIRESEMQKIPYTVVIGDNEVQSGTVALRARKRAKIAPLSVHALVERLNHERIPGGAS